MTEITMGGRTIPLYFTSWEMIAIQERIGCTAAQLRDEVFGLHLADEEDPESWAMSVATDPEKLRKFGTLIEILGNAGLEEQGKEPDLTEKWVLRHMLPAEIVGYAILATLEVNKGMRSEVAEEEQKEQAGQKIDVMVAEEERKKAPAK